ncbi:S-layer homology domain-containing protein [Cohnella lupini]|uniref:S-layer family protein n=1 Tax=Cohnella lupini TaxID=1294267 RepID=A0A3D9I3C1_9BACL|nr:S-layer homology domain-containing protein [Cohnella lupini]RED56257.1 S-layer family protein [Cohnella lupini]
MMRKWCLSALILTILFVTWSIPASAESNPTFEMKWSDTNGIVKVTVQADGLKDMYAFDLIVTFDSGRLSFVSGVTQLEGFAVQPIVKGSTIEFAHTKVGSVPGYNGKADLVTLQFKRVKSGAATISLSEFKLVDSELALHELQAVTSVNLPAGKEYFTDIKGHWAEATIIQAAELGIVSGYDDGTFRPNRTVTREEFAVLLVKALKLTGEGEDFVFTDLNVLSLWAKQSVALAVKAGIINGYSDGTFRPRGEITRLEMASMIARALDLSVKSSGDTGFADDSSIPAWGKEAVKSLVHLGIINGKSANRFDPNGKTTRAEAVTILLRMLEKQEK